MRRGPRVAGIVVVLALLTGACGSSGSTRTATTGEDGSVVVTDDRGSQTCAPDDAKGGTFHEPVIPEPTIDGVERYTGLTHNHVDGCVDYSQNPPVGGNHRAAWQACKFYDRAVPPEQGVHSMEHGAVWITYDPSLSAAERAGLARLARDFVLVSPWNRDPLPSPVVVTAWGLQLELESTDDPRLAEFIATYANGPQNSEPGAPCLQGGSDKTL